MKLIVHVTLLALLCSNCGSNDTTWSKVRQQNARTKNDSLLKKDNLNAIPELVNPKLKEGISKQYLNGKVWKINRYSAGKLDGKNFEFLENGEILETNYKNGIRDGYFLHYAPKSRTAKFATFWKDGKKLWSAFPDQLDLSIIPSKGFITDEDTIEIKIPYNSGKLLYQGRIISPAKIEDECIGKHTLWFENGKIRAIIDYDRDSIKIYNEKGKLLQNTNIFKMRGFRI